MLEHITDVTVQENVETEVEGGSGSGSSNVITADTLPVADYGKYVTNYVPTNGVNDEGIKWKIFYADTEDDNIYLIADTYVPLTNTTGTKNYVPTGYDMTNGRYGFDLIAYKNYNGIADVASDISNKWLEKYATAGYTSNNKYKNGRATAYLLDTNAWSGFKDSTYAEYVVGGPTVELFVASYNKTHTTRTIRTQVNTTGYQIAWNGGTFSNGIYGLNENENLYVISDTFGNPPISQMWLASPSASTEDDVMSVNYEGSIGGYYIESSGGRCPSNHLPKLRSGVRTTSRWKLQNIRRNTNGK